MVGAADNSRNIQVLNISNVNAQGKTVLNDGKLLELVQFYPFLYNPRVIGHEDEDYTMWAWKRINAAFNHSYSADPNAGFSVDDLMNRWKILKPLIQCLSKAYDLQAIPTTLRASVQKITTELEDPSTNCVLKPLNPAQTLLAEEMSNIRKLPLSKRLKLEREVLDLIFDTEKDLKQIKKLSKDEVVQANNECDDFLNQIGYYKVWMTAVSQSQQTKSYANDYSHLPNGIVIKQEEGKWIPLNEVHKHIRPCFVHMKRMNLEDYLPLSQIKKFAKRKRFNDDDF